MIRLAPSKRRIVLNLIWGATALGTLSFKLYAPILPYVARELYITPSQAASSLSLIWISCAIGMIIQGFCAEHYGYRSAFLWSSFLMFLGGGMCFFFSNLWFFFGGVSLFAFGSGNGLVLGVSVIRMIFPDQAEQSLAFSKVFIGSALALVAGPLISEFCETALSWKIPFLVIGLFGGGVFLGFLRYMPQMKPRPSPLKKQFLVLRKILTEGVPLRCIALFILINLVFGIYGSVALFFLTSTLKISYALATMSYSFVAMASVVGTYTTKHLSQTQGDNYLLRRGVQIFLVSCMILLFSAGAYHVGYFDRWELAITIVGTFMAGGFVYGLLVPIIMVLELKRHKTLQGLATAFVRFLWAAIYSAILAGLSYVPRTNVWALPFLMVGLVGLACIVTRGLQTPDDLHSTRVIRRFLNIILRKKI